MKNYLSFILLLLIFSCGKPSKVELKFNDEFVIQENLEAHQQLIGGLSGMDFVNDTLYFVVDDPITPRFLKATFVQRDQKLDSVEFHETIFLKDSTNSFFRDYYLDLESIFVDKNTGRIYFTSEGSIQQNKAPVIFSVDQKGKNPKKLELPEYLEDTSNHFHNKSFEASCLSFSEKGFWFTTEEPLRNDGELTDFKPTNSPLRFCFFDFEENKITKQFVYPLGTIDLRPNGEVKINGVTAILEFAENQFYVVERAYVSGYGSYGNVVKIFKASVEDFATNVNQVATLKNYEYSPMKKELLINLNQYKDRLTEKIIDNIEGIAIGPKAKNGNRMIILVADDNFQKFGRQLNQFIYLEEILNK